MKGVILAGGHGTRLSPLTKVSNKHLLAVYNKPMIYYPIFAIKRAGITDVMIVSGAGHAGGFLDVLKSGEQFGLKFSYEVQEKAGGIAQALGLTESFVSKEKVMVVLGDNIFEDDISDAVRDFELQERGAKIFLKKVKNPQSYGVVKFDAGAEIEEILEKPQNPPSDLAVVGCYMYDSQVFDVVRNLEPSDRKELEITDVNNFYLKQGTLSYNVLEGFWGDCGESFDSLFDASSLVKNSYLSEIDENLNLS